MNNKHFWTLILWGSALQYARTILTIGERSDKNVTKKYHYKAGRTKAVIRLLHFLDFVMQCQPFCRQQIFLSRMIGFVGI